jgi:predicted acyl esterase
VNYKPLTCVQIAALMASVPPLGAPAIAAGRASKPGEYSGYSPVLYDGYQRTSEYVAVRDGTKIAVDIFRPTLKGELLQTKLPVLWMNTPYGRRIDNEGDETAKYYPGAALALVKYGYAVAVADMRGNYASFGRALHTNRTEWAPWAYWDAYDITEWLAARPWSNAKVGMWGCSATGHSQWQAAATHPPHLKAIYPMSAPSEYFDWNGVSPTTAPPRAAYPGPIPKQDAGAASVDGDTDGALLQSAKEEHRYNLDYGYAPYRDSIAPELAARTGIKNFQPWLQVSTFSHFGDLNKAGIPAYETANFGEDQRVKLGVFVKLRNLKSPVKLIFAPGNHCNWSSEYRVNPLNAFNAPAEELRWFDYWLKGVRNGIMDEPPIYYFTYNMAPDQAWRFAWQWPLPTQQDLRYYFAPGAALRLTPNGSGAERYAVKYDVTPANRNARGLAFTSTPMALDTTMTGSPVVHMWVSTSAADGDFFASLADVAPDGTITMLPGTDDGQIRMSMRALNAAPYDNIGLPYHRAFASDRQAVAPGAPTELVFDLAPISWVFKAGHRFRLVITGSAPDRHGGARVTPVLDPAPVVSFLYGAAHPSYILMPAITGIQGRVEARSTGMVIKFPATLDQRYIADLKSGSVLCGETPARRAVVHGREIVVECSTPLKPGSPVTVSGAFGQKYQYGKDMRFFAIANTRNKHQER